MKNLIFIVILSISYIGQVVFANQSSNDTLANVKHRNVGVDYGNGIKFEIRVQEVLIRNFIIASSCEKTINPLFRPVPSYPHKLAKKKIDGDADITLTIDVEGNVSNIKFNSFSRKEFAHTVVNTVKDWKFEPLVCGMIPIEFKVRQEFEFFVR